MPNPQPAPREPQAYQKDDVYSLLTELASSSWDSIYMNASRPLPKRPAPRPVVINSRHSRHRASEKADVSLQIHAGLLNQTPKKPNPPRISRWRRAARSIARGFAAIGQTVMVLGLFHVLRKP